MSSHTPAHVSETRRETPVLHVEPGILNEESEHLAAAVSEQVIKHGAVLVRGLDLRSPNDVDSAAHAVLASTSTEYEGFAPRDSFGSNLYSATHWPSDQPMCSHHELSYTNRPPTALVFGCLQSGTSGGDISLAAAADVFDALPQSLSESFEECGWQLHRNYGGFIGITMEDAFRTTDRAAVETYCEIHGIVMEWGPGGTLHTEQHRPAVVEHRGRRCWFNQIAFLNEWTLEPAVREYLVSEFGTARGLPFTTRRGDGKPITAETVEQINEVYEALAMPTKWQTGDLLVVDNVAMAHSRSPYRGERQVAVVLGDLQE